MRVLSIETATSAGGAALVEDDRVVGEIHSLDPRTHAERILPSIDVLLHDAGWKIGDIGLVAVSAGPGAFTGLRIGIATAKGIAMAANIPLVGVPTLEAFAMLLVGAHGHVPLRANIHAPICIRPVLDARKEEVYTAAFDSSGKRLGPDINVRPQMLADSIKGDGPMLLAGEGARRYRAIFEQVLGENARFVPAEFDDPRPGAVAILGLKLFQGGAPSDIESLVPAYVRRSDQEIHLSKKGL